MRSGAQRMTLSDCVARHLVKGETEPCATGWHPSCIRDSMGRRLVVPLVALFSLASVMLAAFCSSRTPALAIQFAEASTGPIAREVLTSGTLEPARVVDTGTQISGTVQFLYADFNSKLKEGQVIAQLDPSVYDSQLAQARAGVLEAEGAVQEMQVAADDSQTKAQRAAELVERDLITRAEYDTAQLAAKEAAAKLTAARAAAAAARAALQQAQVNRRRTSIHSPIDGVVVSRNVEVGQTLAASIESPVLFRIADLSRMHLLADVGEAEVAGVQVGTPVTFAIESLGPQRFTGTVAEVRLQPVQQAAAMAGTANTAGTASSSQPAGTSGTSTPSAGRASGAANTSPSSPAPGGGSTPAPGMTAPQQAAPASGGSGSGASPPSGGVVSYTAIIEVDNHDHRIPPGSTAIVTLPTSRRSSVLRVPNRALGFRPTPDVLRAAGQEAAAVPRAPSGGDPASGRQAILWKFDRGKFVPIDVRIGVSDENWTEIVSGPIQAGEALVTAAARAR